MSADDRQAIIDVTIAYCWALDTKDWGRLDDVFVPDATADLGGTQHQGRADIIDRISTALSRYDDSQHMVTNHEVRVDGDEATCRCYLQAQHVSGGPLDGDNYLVGGRYEDRLVRTPDGWRIAHRELIVMWTDGVR